MMCNESTEKSFLDLFTLEYKQNEGIRRHVLHSQKYSRLILTG